MTATPAQLDEPTYPYPPRYRWLKRITVISLTLIVAFVALMAWWRHEAGKRLGEEVAKVRAAGEPLLVADFTIAPVPDESNAALSLKAAAAANTPPKDLDDYLDGYELFRAKDDYAINQLRRIYEATSTTRQHIRRARFQPETDWNLTLRTPAITVGLPHLSSTRELMPMLSCSAELAHLNGNDSEAIELIRDAQNISEQLERYGPYIVTHLTAIGCSRYATTLIRLVAADLTIAPERDATTQSTGAASRAQVRQLIAELLDERGCDAALRSAMRGERMAQYDSLVYYFVGSNPGFFASVGVNPGGVLTPMFQLDGVRILRRANDLIRAADASDYPTTAARAGGRFPTGGTTLTNISALPQSMLSSSSSRFFLIHYRFILQRRVAALRLAIRLYQLDHNDRLPTRLDELVPDYIPAVPLDPFDPAGQPLRYVSSSKPLIYSVCENGIDEGGDTKYLGKKSDPFVPGSVHDANEWDRADVIFPIEKPDLAPAKATGER